MLTSGRLVMFLCPYCALPYMPVGDTCSLHSIELEVGGEWIDVFC